MLMESMDMQEEFRPAVEHTVAQCTEKFNERLKTLYLGILQNES